MNVYFGAHVILNKGAFEMFSLVRNGLNVLFEMEKIITFCVLTFHVGFIASMPYPDELTYGYEQPNYHQISNVAQSQKSYGNQQHFEYLGRQFPLNQYHHQTQNLGYPRQAYKTNYDLEYSPTPVSRYSDAIQRPQYQNSYVPEAPTSQQIQQKIQEQIKEQVQEQIQEKIKEQQVQIAYKQEADQLRTASNQPASRVRNFGYTYFNSVPIQSSFQHNIEVDEIIPIFFYEQQLPIVNSPSAAWEEEPGVYARNPIAETQAATQGPLSQPPVNSYQEFYKHVAAHPQQRFDKDFVQNWRKQIDFESPKQKKRYLIIHKDGSTEYVDNLDYIKEKYPNHVLVDASNNPVTNISPPTVQQTIPQKITIANPTPIHNSQRSLPEMASDAVPSSINTINTGYPAQPIQSNLPSTQYYANEAQSLPTISPINAPFSMSPPKPTTAGLMNITPKDSQLGHQQQLTTMQPKSKNLSIAIPPNDKSSTAASSESNADTALTTKHSSNPATPLTTNTDYASDTKAESKVLSSSIPNADNTSATKSSTTPALTANAGHNSVANSTASTIAPSITNGENASTTAAASSSSNDINLPDSQTQNPNATKPIPELNSISTISNPLKDNQTSSSEQISSINTNPTSVSETQTSSNDSKASTVISQTSNDLGKVIVIDNTGMQSGGISKLDSKILSQLIGDNEYSLVQFFLVPSPQRIIERNVTRVIFEQGNVFEEVVESVKNGDDGEPIITKDFHIYPAGDSKAVN